MFKRKNTLLSSFILINERFKTAGSNESRISLTERNTSLSQITPDVLQTCLLLQLMECCFWLQRRQWELKMISSLREKYFS